MKFAPVLFVVHLLKDDRYMKATRFDGAILNNIEQVSGLIESDEQQQMDVAISLLHLR